MAAMRSRIGAGLLLAGLIPLHGFQKAAEAGHARIRNLGNGPLAVNVGYVAVNEFHVLSEGWILVQQNQEVNLAFPYDKCFVLIQRENDKFVPYPNRERQRFPIYHKGHVVKVHPTVKTVTTFETEDKPGTPVNTQIGQVPAGWKLVDHYAVADGEVLTLLP